jgi:putative ABC transport system permease protein
MKTLSLALRNLLRNRRRSLMTLFAMVIGLIAVLLFGGYIKDINYGLQTGYVQRSGHLQIQHKDYFLYGSGNPGAYGIADYDRIIAMLKKDEVLAPMLTVVTPTLQLGGIAGNFSAGVSRTIYASGAVVEDQNRMRAWNDYRFPSRPQSLTLTGTAPDTAVIGTGVARVLQLCGALAVPNCQSIQPASTAQGAALPADIAELAASGRADVPAATDKQLPRIEILAANSHGAPNVAGVTVLKAEYQGVKELDDVYVALHLSQAQKLIFGAEPPQVTAIVLQLQHTAQMPVARARLEQMLATTLKGEPLEIQDYETLNPFYGQTLNMFAAIFGFIAVLIGAIVLFTVSNTMSMAVVERTAEIGTLRAMGLRRGGIRSMFVSEGIVIGMLGALLGIVVALVAAWVINHMGLTWTPPGRIEPVPLSVRILGENRMLIGSAIGLVVVAALSAIWPAARAARMNIVDALRHV